MQRPLFSDGFDGIQHFTPRRSTDQQFANGKIRDKMKDDYALKNSMVLIRIPYYNFEKINEIIKGLLGIE